jgi:hypothetical protein
MTSRTTARTRLESRNVAAARLRDDDDVMSTLAAACTVLRRVSLESGIFFTARDDGLSRLCTRARDAQMGQMDERVERETEDS